MKYLATPGATNPQDALSVAGAGWETDGPQWVLEELTEVRETLGSRWSNRWLGVLVAIAVGIVGFGFVSQGSAETLVSPERRDVEPVDPDHRPTSEAPFLVTAPIAGAIVREGVVAVRGIATRPLGSVHLAVLLGDAVLGWANVDVQRTGPVLADIPVFAPRFDAVAELRIGIPSSRFGSGSESTVPLRLHSPEEVGIWRIVQGGSPNAPTMVVHGFAPHTIERVDLHVRTEDGHELGSSLAPVAYEAGRPGSFGGRLIGLGSFTGRISLEAPPTAEQLVLTVTWRDPLTEIARGIVQTIAIPPNLASGRSVEHDGGSLEGP